MATPYKLRDAATEAGYEGDQKEKRFVLATLKAKNQNGSRKTVKQAADEIGISEQALHRFMRGRIILNCDWIDIEPTIIDIHPTSKE